MNVNDIPINTLEHRPVCEILVWHRALFVEVDSRD